MNTWNVMLRDQTRPSGQQLDNTVSVLAPGTLRSMTNMGMVAVSVAKAGVGGGMRPRSLWCVQTQVEGRNPSTYAAGRIDQETS